MSGHEDKLAEKTLGLACQELARMVEQFEQGRPFTVAQLRQAIRETIMFLATADYSLGPRLERTVAIALFMADER